MFLRTALLISILSPTLLAADLELVTLAPNQSTKSLRELTRQALDRQIHSAFQDKGPHAKTKRLPSYLKPLTMSDNHVVIASADACSIPLTEMRKDSTKHFAVQSIPVPQRDFDSIAKVPPFPACKK